MAAVQWSGGKCKSVQQIKAWFRHNDMESRKETHHTNPHINKDMTKHNFTYRGLDYQGMCDAFDKRLEEVDTGRQSSGKNARVLLQSVVIYLPEGLCSRDLQTKAKWFRRAGDILEDRYGKNFVDMQVDFDENHTYYDKEKKEHIMSREHGHARLFPEVSGKLNGKAFCSRAAITDLNNALHEMSLKEFGCPMMDGSKVKGGQTVEQLKAKSEAAEIIVAAEASAEAVKRAAVAEAREIIAAAEEDRQKAAETLKKAQVAFSNMKQDAYDRGFREFLAGFVVGKQGRTAEDFIDSWERAYRQELQEKLELESPKRRKTGGKKQKAEPAAAVSEPKAKPEQPQQLDSASQARIQATLADLGYQAKKEDAEDYMGR